MSRCLAERSIDHVVLERGEVANSWRTERWDSLRLLTPNWQSRLPGFGYDGDDPDGFRTMPETIDFIARYARAIAAPVETAHDRHVRARSRRRLSSSRPTAATGAAGPSCSRPAPATSPAFPRLRRRGAAARSRRSRRWQYRNPDQLADGRRARRRRVGDRHPARRRDPPLRPPGDALRRRARPRAARLSRQGHPVVDGRGRRARRALRPDRRHRPGAPRAVAAARRLARAHDARSQRAQPPSA